MLRGIVMSDNNKTYNGEKSDVVLFDNNSQTAPRRRIQ
jgi:hypothetical protein